MGSHRRASDNACLPAPSRRDILGVAASAPAAAATSGTFRIAPADDLVARCAEWLSLDLRINRLSLRWSALETRAAREFDWFKLSLAQRRALPLGVEMFEIDARLDRLSEERVRRFEALAALEARDLDGAAGKLAVAARVLEDEGGPAYRLVADAARVLAARRRPSGA